jgi:hypothetical protein
MWTFDPAPALAALVLLALFFCGAMFALALRQLAIGGGQ